jgi:hypothetical protein
VEPGDVFDVEFDVSLVASAGFLNGVYELLDAVAIPITSNQATISTASGATGSDVVVVADGAVTIPSPDAVPVTSDVEVPIGTVVGTYEATTSGAISFKVVGNPFSPDDPLPDGFSEPGWTGAAATAALTPSGSSSAARASLLGGLVKPYLVCIGGAWTANADGTYGTPLVQNDFEIAINGLVPSTTTTSTIPLSPSTTDEEEVLGSETDRLPATGVDRRRLYGAVLTGLLLIQIGVLLRLGAQPNRRLRRLMQAPK